IDDVGVWDRPITEAEIATIWNGGEGTPLVTTPGGAVELVPDLIAYFPFDGASDLVDKVAGLEGEAQGELADADGVIGSAVDLGEAENWIKVDAEATGWLAPASDNNALSVSLWQKLNVVRNSSTFWFRAEAAGSNARNAQAHIPWGNNSIFFDTSGCCGGTQRISKAADIDFLEWHHFVFTKNEDGHKEIYIDGALWHEGENTGPLFDDWTYLAIGSSGTGDYAHAIVDEFGVWGRAITASEVAAIYNGGAGAPLISAGSGTPSPKLAGMVANGLGFSFQVEDVDGATVDPESIAVNFDGADVEVTKSTADGVTTVSYVSAEMLAPDSEHNVRVSVTDTNGNSSRLEKAFKVKAYSVVDPNSRVADSLKGDSGFLVYATQISSGQGVGNVHGNSKANAEKQVNGEYIDPDTEE
ncbi:MAG TPA: LamG domain-containing protein, partial [Verrucomicrobiota bacterium]|nr:LamG domain-containing protein [Verrucomicrobiota bacterium]